MAHTLVRRLLDVLLAITFVAVCWNGAQAYRAHREVAERRAIEALPPAGIGAALDIDGLAWRTAPRHLVLVLSPQCAACNKGAPFYVSLADRAAALSPRVPVTVLSQAPEDDLRAWLAANGIRSDRVARVERLGRFGIRETPTLLLVDANGRVTDILTRLLDAQEERQLVTRLEGTSTEPLDNVRRIPELVAADLPALRTSVLLDIRARADFAAAHRAGAVNIPQDELEERLRAEIPADRDVLVDCQDLRLSKCRAAAEIVVRTGYRSVALIRP